MWHNIKRFLIVASVTVNIAFVGVWIAHAVPVGTAQGGAAAPPATTRRIWCPLHEQLNVSDEQWKRIEPRLKEFRETAQSVCRHMGTLRSEMLELIAAPTPDRESIAAKQEEIRASQRKMQGLVVDQLLAEKEVLTAEQEQQLFALLREHSGGRGGHVGLSGASRGGIGRVLRDGPKEQ